MPAILREFFDERTSRERRAGTIAGLMEGIAVSGYAVIMDELTPWAAIATVLFLAFCGLVGAVIWTVVSKILRRLLRSDAWVFKITFPLLIATVAFGRLLLDDRTPDRSWQLCYLGIGLLLVAPLHKKNGPWRFINPAVEIVAVCLVTSLSLLGRIPDFSFTIADTVIILASSSLVAVLLYELLIRSQPVLLLLVLGFLDTAAAPSVGRDPPRKPNVLFVLVDTLRRDHVSPYGDMVDTPAIEELAEESVLFDDAVTVIPKTTSSVASIFTGKYPVNHGVRSLYARLEQEQTTLAETLLEEGYSTDAFVNNAWLSRGAASPRGSSGSTTTTRWPAATAPSSS